ncbi:MAG: DUF86 domain-containing protein [Spirochaetales bacterium]|nr:DUF86 domain-containing protein [Spirochaetales bacterium]
MENDLIISKLELLKKYINRIEEKTPPKADILLRDFDLQDIITLNLERAVQISVDIGSHILSSTDIRTPKTMSETFKAIADHNVISTDLAERMRKSVGFRNIAVHEYEKIDWNVVYTICTRHLKDFRDFAAAILKYLGVE